MEVEPGDGWADAVSKILRMGKNNPESNKILSKAKKDVLPRDDTASLDAAETTDEEDQASPPERKQSEAAHSICITKKLKPDPQRDALLENELKEAATRGVVHLFNAVKTVNPKSDKKKKKRKKKNKRMKRRKTR